MDSITASCLGKSIYHRIGNAKRRINASWMQIHEWPQPPPFFLPIALKEKTVGSRYDDFQLQLIYWHS